MKHAAVLVLIGLVTAACGGREAADPDFGDGAAPAIDCGEDAGSTASTLSCTGLYSNVLGKKIAAGVLAFAPAVPLWSDGAEKQRWIALPKGTKIDATDPEEWSFPVGTKVWKEFSVAGKRVETRLFQKVLSNHWVHATYAWNEDESEAKVSPGGDIQGPAGIYHIPVRSECDDCHRGRTDNILGFEQVSLGLPGAQGITLDDLVEKKLISPAPKRTHLEIGDDGTGAAAPALAWLHINCGTTCHNGNSNAIAYGAKMRLRLDPELLDGRAVNAFDSVVTTQGIAVNNPGWHGQVRVVPGSPEESLLVTLISNRGVDNPAKNQMPPIASRVVDKENVKKVVEWIRRMPRGPGQPLPDAGEPPPLPDASEPPPPRPDASEPPHPDASASDAGHGEKDGGVRDASLDASVDAKADAGHHPVEAGTKDAAEGG